MLDLPRNAEGGFALPSLRYAHDALDPVVDARTVEIHWGKHTHAYLNNLNAALDKAPEFKAMSLQQILANLDKAPADVKTALTNNGGGVSNHVMYWDVMGPNGGTPSGALLAAIEEAFGDVETFKTKFDEAGVKQFGSGWVNLVIGDDGRLMLEGRLNQDTPLTQGRSIILGNDVWEHAYYLVYQNRRPDYLKSWWDVVDWAHVGKRFDMIKAGQIIL